MKRHIKRKHGYKISAISGYHLLLILLFWMYTNKAMAYDVLLNETMISPIKTTERQHYNKLKKKIIRILPYLNYVKEKYTYLKDSLSNVKKSLRKRYIRTTKKEINESFKAQLKNLYVSEGRILIKLINRELDITVYDLLKEIKNGVSAFVYQMSAGMYKLNLKDKLDPLNNREDYLIERIMVVEDLPLYERE